MAESTTTPETSIADKALKELGPIAEVLKTSASVIWKAFVMKYVARGLGEVLVSVFVAFVSIRLLGITTLWLFVPAALITALLFDAVQCLVNPTYYAMMDALEKAQEIRQDNQTQKVEVYDKWRSYY